MNKIFTFLIGIFILIGVTSCSQNDEPIPTVDVKLSYSFTSGIMSRAAEDVYNDFYEKCILSKEQTPAEYNLSFYYKQKEKIMSCNGKWQENNSFCLPVGEYYVTGYSEPNRMYNASDTVYISFDTNIDISLNTIEIVIPAQYNCHLLLFKSDYIESFKYYQSYIDFVEFIPTNGYYGIFVKTTTTYSQEYFQITKTGGDVITIYPWSTKFEKGKYYYFNDATNSFFLEPMENGSN